jgi:hypothetical protein
MTLETLSTIGIAILPFAFAWALLPRRAGQ